LSDEIKEDEMSTGHMTKMQKRNVYVKRPRHRWRNNIKINLTDIVSLLSLSWAMWLS
jgi:hypothetical protein